MRTNTRILWTILVIDFLLLLAESDPTPSALAKPTTAAATTIKPTDAQPTTVTVSITTVTLPDAGPTNATTSHSVSTPGKPVTTEPPTTKPITKEPTSTNLATIVPTDVKATTNESISTMPAPTGSPTAKLPTKVPITTMPATTVPATTVPATKKPTPEKPTPEKPTPENPTTEKVTPEKPTPENPTTAKPIPADSTSASHTGSGPAPSHPATPAPSSVVSTPRQPASDQTPALGPKTPASSTVTAKQPASTQPGPNPTKEEPLDRVEIPELDSDISQPFNETFTMDYMQDPRHQKNSFVQSCQMLMEKVGGRGTCSLAGEKKNGRYEFSSVTLAVDSKVMQEIYDTINKPPAEPTPVPHTLIAILSSCGALVLILVIFALYCTYHHRSYRKNQQHLTEELQTVENGYHDNPTLEVMEVQPEMQEKKMALNGEFNDSWIVPFDNLAKEETPDEEDTHL